MPHSSKVKAGEGRHAGAEAVSPRRSYVIGCTPRVGSHMLADALSGTRIAGHPRERFPRLTAGTTPTTARERERLVMHPPPEDSYDAQVDAAYVRKVLSFGTGANGVFGVVIHWLQLKDAVRRIQAFLGTNETSPHTVLSGAFPSLSYVWLRRKDRVAQAVSWYKAIQTGTYVGRHAPDMAADAIYDFDYRKMRFLLSAIVSFENAWASFFADNDLKPFVLHYEDLSSKYVDTVRAVLRFLDLNATGVHITGPRHPKYADARSLEWVRRFKQQHNRS